DISGIIDDDINAEQSIVLRSSAEVAGEISTDKIKFEAGAKVKGNFKVGSLQHAKQKEKYVSDVSKTATSKAS
ncbi:MAG: polymer-forming cytoskeletal protein, partial [Balneolaceae bacterium]|nr:polymer-forming cytoskeletal protein [Balneolaceae bacterium]